MPHNIGLGMVEFEDSELSKTLNENVERNKVGDQLRGQDTKAKEKDRKRNAFFAVERLVDAAKGLYVDEGEDFGAVVNDLGSAVMGLRDREDELLSAVEKDMQDIEENEPEEEPETSDAS